LKAIIAAAVATEFILAVTLIAGTLQAIKDFRTYGPTYVETIIINGVESTKTVSWVDSAFTMIVLLWFLILYIFFTKDVYENEKEKKLND
jgi:energy-coupling factor transporter transmembrane protein EcfT